MLNRIDSWFAHEPDEMPATGTFADGVFHLTRNERMIEARRENLRTSYGRDFRIAHRLADTPSPSA